MKDLLKKYPILKDVFSLNEEDRSLEIYSEAMCKIRWDMHPIYGQDDCVKDQKRDLIEKFIVDGIENAISYYNTYIYDGCNGYHFAKDYPQFTKYGLVYGCSENAKLEKQKRISKNCDAIRFLTVEENISDYEAQEIILNFVKRTDPDHISDKSNIESVHEDIKNYAHRIFLHETLEKE